MNGSRQANGGALLSALLIVFLALAAGACTIKLAPNYDQSIVDGLGKLNQDAQIFFAALADGSGTSGFAKQEATYNQLIGQADALRIQAKARPEPPPPAIVSWLSSGLPNDIPPQLKTPTPEILGNLATALTSMRDRHKKDGLTPEDVLDSKQSFEQKMGQALTYEKALKR